MEALYKLFVHSPMNWIEITGTNRGLRSLHFAEEKGAMDVDVPNFLTDTVGQLDEYFHGQRRRFTIPLDMDGTGATSINCQINDSSTGGGDIYSIYMTAVQLN